jgi:hypothetical protein
LRPSGGITIDDLVHHLSKVPVLPFNRTIRLEIVTRDANMGDTILCFEPIEGSDIESTIISDELSDGTISAEDILEDEVHDIRQLVMSWWSFDTGIIEERNGDVGDLRFESECDVSMKGRDSI